MSYAGAARIESLDDNSVLISINEEDLPLRKLKLDRNSSKVLTVVFSDVTAKVNVKGLVYNPIDTEQALKILDFVNINKNKNFYVHCAAGVSRSAAICLYLNLVHGHELKPNFWSVSRPNPFVLGKLFILKNNSKK